MVKGEETIYQSKPGDINKWLDHVKELPADDSEGVYFRAELMARGELPRVDFSDNLNAPAKAAPRGNREIIWHEGNVSATPIYHAEDVLGEAKDSSKASETIKGTNKISGPAIIEAKDTTIAIPPNWNLETDMYRQFILSKEA